MQEGSKMVMPGPTPMPDDPWIDPWLNYEPRCDSCKYHVPSPRGETKGRCRRHAPTHEGYPMTDTHADWCGDYKERKIDFRFMDGPTPDPS